VVEVRPSPVPGMGKADLLRTSTQWAAGDSNPAPRIKRHVVPVLGSAARCSFVLVRAGMGVGYVPIRPAP
jgi:hypothetical protein